MASVYPPFFSLAK